MKIIKYISIEEVEVEIDVTFADLVEEMIINADNTRAMLSGFNMSLSFMKSLPDELLSTLNQRQQDIIVNALSEQLTRIKSAIKS